MTHYVYKLIDNRTQEFYIGSRTTKGNLEDDNYMGSMITWKPDKSKLRKIILKCFDTRNEANIFEAKLIKKWFGHSLNRNYNIPILDDNGKPKYTFKGKNHSDAAKNKMYIHRIGKSFDELYGIEKSLDIKLKLTNLAKTNTIGWGNHPNIENPMKNISVKDVWCKKYGEESAEIMWKNRYDKRKGIKPWNTNIAAIEQLDKTGNIVNIFLGLDDIITKNPTFIKSNICNVLKGRRNVANGYRWKYTNDQ